MKRNGFSLIEITVVVVILSVIAAFTLPRFVSVRGDAKAASMRGLAGAIRSAAAQVQMKWTVKGQSGTTVTMGDGTVVDVGPTGLPRASASGIDRAVDISAQYVCSGSPVRTCTLASGPAGCRITYNELTGSVDDSDAFPIGSVPPAKGKGKGKGVTPGC